MTTHTLTVEEINVLEKFHIAGNTFWISEAKKYFASEGDIIQSLADKKLLTWDDLMIQVTDAGRDAYANAAGRRRADRKRIRNTIYQREHPKGKTKNA